MKSSSFCLVNFFTDFFVDFKLGEAREADDNVRPSCLSPLTLATRLAVSQGRLRVVICSGCRDTLPIMKMVKIRLTRGATNGRRWKPGASGESSIRRAPRTWLNRAITCLVRLCGVLTRGFQVVPSFSDFPMTTGKHKCFTLFSKMVVTLLE